MKNRYFTILFIFGLIVPSLTKAQIIFPFFDNVENDSLSRTYWRPDSATWNITVTAGHSGIRAWQYSPTTTTYKYLTLASPIILTAASNPYLSFWIRNTQTSYPGYRGYYRVQVSNDGGTSWTDLIPETLLLESTPGWIRQQASLANYRQPNVLVRLGVKIWSSGSPYPTFQIDDVLIDNAPTPTYVTVTNVTNNGIGVSWGQSTAPDFYRYRFVLSTDANNVNFPSDASGGSSISGRFERRVFDVFTKATVETTLTDLAFTNTTYYVKVYEEDTQGFVNQGTDQVQSTTTYTMTSHVAPFVQNFEGTFQLAADVPWAITTADSAEPGHSPTHAYEDSPEGNYPPNADRRLVFQTTLGATARPVLRFKHRYAFEYGNDFGRVEASNDNVNWTNLGVDREFEFACYLVMTKQVDFVSFFDLFGKWLAMRRIDWEGRSIHKKTNLPFTWRVIQLCEKKRMLPLKTKLPTNT